MEKVLSDQSSSAGETLGADLGYAIKDDPNLKFQVPDFAAEMRSLFADRRLAKEDSAAIREGMRGDR